MKQGIRHPIVFHMFVCRYLPNLEGKKHPRDRDRCVFTGIDVKVAYDFKLHKLEFIVYGSVLVCKHCTRVGGGSSDGMRLHQEKAGLSWENKQLLLNCFL